MDPSLRGEINVREGRTGGRGKHLISGVFVG